MHTWNASSHIIACCQAGLQSTATCGVCHDGRVLNRFAGVVVATIEKAHMLVDRLLRTAIALASKVLVQNGQTTYVC
jgi:hypothetical protein